ncbi:aldo/keto reductase [Halofilum ochraceum]|uniref:aldo/keto reductase n=1 Tax=Halofilum ochraceum TaxID=1611323 RepID=UPI001C2F679F|nr:aldo/keto reductase [Halofilum ochraceum]
MNDPAADGDENAHFGNRSDAASRHAGVDAGRRSFCKLLAGSLLIPHVNLSVAADGGMMHRRIPGTQETLPVVGLGTSDEFEVPNEADLDALRMVLHRFHELGGTLVDTAPIYGNAESVIGGLLADLELTDDLFVATKVRTSGREAGLEQMERSQELLGKRPLDLMQVHSLVDWRTQLRNLRQWKEEGRVRYIGVTHSRTSAFEELEKVMRSEPLDFVQFNYSFTEPEAEARLLPLAAERGMAVMVNRPFENGALFRAVRDRQLPEWAADFDCESWAQFSLKYILAHPAVTCVIPATSNPKHVADNMGAGTGRLPDEHTRQRMRELGASL